MCIKKEELPTVKTSIGFLFCMKSMMLSIEGRFIAKGFSMLITSKRIFSSIKSLILHEICHFLFEKGFLWWLHSQGFCLAWMLWHSWNVTSCSRLLTFVVFTGLLTLEWIPVLGKRWATIDPPPPRPAPDSLLSEQMSPLGILKSRKKFEFWLEALT